MYAITKDTGERFDAHFTDIDEVTITVNDQSIKITEEQAKILAQRLLHYINLD